MRDIKSLLKGCTSNKMPGAYHCRASNYLFNQLPGIMCHLLHLLCAEEFLKQKRNSMTGNQYCGDCPRKYDARKSLWEENEPIKLLDTPGNKSILHSTSRARVCILHILFLYSERTQRNAWFSYSFKTEFKTLVATSVCCIT